MCIIVTVRESSYSDKLLICILFQKVEKKHVMYKVKTYLSVLFVKLRNTWVLLQQTPHISQNLFGFLAMQFKNMVLETKHVQGRPKGSFLVWASALISY